MHPHFDVLPLRSYRAHLVPPHINPEDVEDLADAGQLPTIRLKAATASPPPSRRKLTPHSTPMA